MWKRETGNIYVDLLKNVKFVPKNLRLNRVKNNSLASNARLKGNDKFYQNDYEGAMMMYNESICLAESGSEHSSLGYANRSNCFLKMQLYNQCLVDIQLAMDNGYPKNLMVKLENRKHECQKRLENFTQPEPILNEASINVPDGSLVPWVSTAIQRDLRRVKGYIANQDIQVGHTLLMEESYVHMMQSGETNYCSSCWKEKMNFIPCSYCADTMYCSSKCANNNFHESECEMAIHCEDHIDGESSIFILRSVIIGINSFADVNEMMDFVEKCLSPQPFVDDPSKQLKAEYRKFLKLPSIVSNQRISGLSRKCYIIFDAIMNSGLAGKFQTKPLQRFLMHLIAHHILILRSNSFMGGMQPDDTRFFQKLDLLTSYFDHSCIPNIIHLDKERMTVIKTILPIKRGDQLRISYINCEDYKKKGERIAYLQDVYGIRCKCKLCTVGVSNFVDAEKDEDFNFVAEKLIKLNEKFDFELARDIKNHCVQFLMKYLDKGVCKESVFISNSLGDVLRLEVSKI